RGITGDPRSGERQRSRLRARAAAGRQRSAVACLAQQQRHAHLPGDQGHAARGAARPGHAERGARESCGGDQPAARGVMVQGLTQQETIGASASRRTPRLRWLGPYLLLLPAFVFIAVFVFWPVIYSVYLSLQDWRLGFGSSRFVGVRNYVRLFSAPDFLNALRVTVGYTLVTSCGSIVLGLALALAIQHVRRLG